MPANTRLSGHTLWSEGWPVEVADNNDRGWRELRHRSDVGRALCSCGEMSEVLLSAAERQRWHREIHKPAVREASNG